MGDWISVDHCNQEGAAAPCECTNALCELGLDQFVGFGYEQPVEPGHNRTLRLAENPRIFGSSVADEAHGLRRLIYALTCSNAITRFRPADFAA